MNASQPVYPGSFDVTWTDHSKQHEWSEIVGTSTVADKATSTVNDLIKRRAVTVMTMKTEYQPEEVTADELRETIHGLLADRAILKEKNLSFETNAINDRKKIADYEEKIADYEEKIADYKQKTREEWRKSIRLNYIREELQLITESIYNTDITKLDDFFTKLLVNIPKRCKDKIHYHFIQWEDTDTTTLGDNLAQLFSFALKQMLAETTDATFSKYLSLYGDTSAQEVNFIEDASHHSLDSFIQNRKWDNSIFLPIKLRDTILWYIEFSDLKAFKFSPEEFPRSVNEILKTAELYLSHVNTYFTKIQLQDVNKRQSLQHQEQTEASYRDQLTNIYNRRGFYEKAIELFLANPESTGGLIAFDLDRFKKVNDELGHNGGDAVLKHAAQKIQEVLKDIPGALLARFGGEEFIAILPGLSSEETFEVAEIIRKHLSGEQFVYRVNNKDPQALNITTSIGVTQYWSNIGKLTAGIFHDQENMNTADRDEGRKRVGDELWKNIRDADQALYHAKKSGRDITIEYTPKLDHNNLQNYAAQKFSLLKRTIEKFFITNFLNNTKAPVASENIKKIFSSKGSKNVLPLRGSDRKD